MQIVGEPVTVDLTVDGSPAAFRWHSRRYRVTAAPVQFFVRRPWWAEQDRVPKGAGPTLMETEVWRLTAAGKDRNREQVFELEHGGDSWVLARITG